MLYCTAPEGTIHIFFYTELLEIIQDGNAASLNPTHTVPEGQQGAPISSLRCGKATWRDSATNPPRKGMQSKGPLGFLLIAEYLLASALCP